MGYELDYRLFNRIRPVRFVLYLLFIFVLANALGPLLARWAGLDGFHHSAVQIVFYLLGFRYVGKVLRRSEISPVLLFTPIPKEFTPLKMGGIMWGVLSVNLGLASLTVVLWTLLFSAQALEFLNRLEFTSAATDSVPLIIVKFVIMVVLAPIFEELVFRGIILNYARQRWNLKLAVMISAVLFAFGHIPNLLGPLFGGVILALLYLRTNTLVAPILVHAANNLVGFVMQLRNPGLDLTLPGTGELIHLVIVGTVVFVAGLWPLIRFVRASVKHVF